MKMLGHYIRLLQSTVHQCLMAPNYGFPGAYLFLDSWESILNVAGKSGT